MYLWTEFEGVTIDSSYPLTKLVQTEGRSAFFSTRNANGESVLIRIIECHFDEDEILARWRGLQTLSHPNFLHIDRFGKFYMAADDITAVYVVFERVDANLGDVLERGALSATDVTQIGLSVTSALETLHAAGFVHEHIEPRNIFAVAEKVKLRSDCIRETPEGEAGMEARRHDVHDLAAMLMQVLLGAPRGSSATWQAVLPAPFDEVVRNGMNGSWGLAEIKAALGRQDFAKSVLQKFKRTDPVPAPAQPVALKPEVSIPEVSIPEISIPEISKPTDSATQVGSTANGDFSTKAFSADQNSRSAASKATAANGAAANGSAKAEPWPAFDFDAAKHASFPKQKSSLELPVIFGISERDFRKWLAAGVLLLGVVLIGWILLHHWFGHGSGGTAKPGSAQTEGSSAHVAATPKTESSQPAARAAKAGSQRNVEWRVVAFTYNREDQAQKKASSLMHQHPELSPTAFSATGKAPWLVTIGGVLQRDAAYALARKARSLGLPRDTYAQDYNAR